MATSTRIFSFGLGHSPSRSLVKGLARATNGRFVFIPPNSNVDVHIGKQLQKALQSCITNIQVEWKLGTTVMTAPTNIPPVYVNDRLIVYALANDPMFVFNDKSSVELRNDQIRLGQCLCILEAISMIFGNSSNACLIKTGPVAELVEFLSLIIAYSFGLFVARRYYETGLRIFASLIVLEMVMISIGIIIVVLIIFGAIPRTAPNSTAYREHDSLMIRTQIGAFYCAFVYIVTFILDIIIVKFAFKLAKLIAVERSSTMPQI
ncbi:unnamed protein product [Rotaria sp. Silwood1]|nr:unnamed protein product [Rotaria sp. Silwood1]